MELYLIRHAHAVALEDLAPSGSGRPRSDAERPLSEQGRARFASVVRALERMGVRFARVEHSPLLRAVQTAELLQPVTDGGRVANAALADEPSKKLLAALATDRTALVGHEPYLSQLVALLAFGDKRAAAGLRFGKGTVALLEGDPGAGGMQLSGLWPAKKLAELASKLE